jgi:hypothetical protein
MNSIHNERYDEIKSLLKKSKMIFEQANLNGETDTQVNVAKDIETKITQDNQEFEKEEEVENSPKDKVQKYRVSGGILALHGKQKTDLDITTDDKLAFQQTMDEFIEEVSDLVDFNTLDVYPNNVQWSGKLIDENLEFIFTIGEDSGIYIQGNMIKVDKDFIDTINKLQSFYEKFKSKWAKILAGRKKTREVNV